MKTAGIFFLVLFFTGALNAQCYSVTSTTYNHVPLTSPTPVTMLDDHYTGKIAIGFSFCFYGASHDSLLIGENGVLLFNLTSANSYCPWPITGAIPTTVDPMNAILFSFQDLGLYAGGSISYQIMGVMPNRKFIVEFDSVPMYSCTNLPFSGQVTLYETSNVIEMDITQKQVCATWNGGYAIEGIQNSLGTSAAVVPGRNYPMQWSATNDAWLFTPTCDVCTGVGIPDPQISGLSLFASDHNQITVVPNNNSYKLLSVYNMLGEEVKFTQTENIISLAEVTPGIYIVNLEINGTRVVKKVMMN